MPSRLNTSKPLRSNILLNSGQVNSTRCSSLTAAAAWLAVEQPLTIRSGDDQDAAWPQDPPPFGQRGIAVGHMLDHFAGVQGVEAGAGERQALHRPSEAYPGRSGAT